jgi:hypothetical protein
MNRRELGFMAVGITTYLNSKYFTELAPGTQRMRRNLLNNVFAHVQRQSAENEVGGPSETPVDLPPPDPPRPTRSAAWHPARPRRNWKTA